MKFRFSYIIFFLLITANIFCQDIIVKRDSTKIIVKGIEIHPTQIHYKSFENQSGTTYIIDKNEIAYINYTNGTKEIFQLSLAEQSANNLVIEKPKDTFVKFNIQAGVVVNNAYSNFYQRIINSGQATRESYSGNNDEKYFANINIGCNFLFGNKYKTKTVLGINYLRSKGEYVHNYYGLRGGNETFQSKLKYVSKIDFINIVFGYRFQIGKHLQIESLIAFNIQASAQRIASGTNVTTTGLGSPNNSGAIVETEYITNKKYGGSDVDKKLLLSFCPKISYEFKIKDKIVGCYLSYNLNRNYKLPWYLIGFTYYPFKKLR